MVEIQSKQDVWGSIPVSSSGKQIFDLAMHLKVDLLSVTHPGSPSMIFSVLWLIKTPQAPYPQSEEREMEIDLASCHQKIPWVSLLKWKPKLFTWTAQRKALSYCRKVTGFE